MSTEERLEAYPELKKCVNAMLDIAEDATGTLKKADDAEIKVIDNMRKMGTALLQEWAIQQEKTTTSQWKQEHKEAKKHGKKKSTGKQHLDD